MTPLFKATEEKTTRFSWKSGCWGKKYLITIFKLHIITNGAPTSFHPVKPPNSNAFCSATYSPPSFFKHVCTLIRILVTSYLHHCSQCFSTNTPDRETWESSSVLFLSCCFLSFNLISFSQLVRESCCSHCWLPLLLLFLLVFKPLPHRCAAFHFLLAHTVTGSAAQLSFHPAGSADVAPSPQTQSNHSQQPAGPPLLTFKIKACTNFYWRSRSMVSRCPHFYTSFSFFFFFWLLSLGTICLLLTLPLAPSSSPIWVSSFTTCTNLLCGLPACSPFSASFVQYVQYMHMSTPSQPCLTNVAPKLLYLSCLSDVLVLILSIQATLIDEIICSAFWNSAL